ncbi:MAG TPA: hypothetical protein VNH46_12940 [Gemmatimonadales bacterium]|nr:hypothetical protein [Gemmatimonadales bacterium]
MRRAVTFMPLLLALAPVVLAAQGSLTLAAGAGDPSPERLVQRAVFDAELEPYYQVRLVSDWPQLSNGGLGCVNGGQEVLEGTLTRASDGGYEGTLRRTATIRFCGVHGGAREACALTLTSAGTVKAEGRVTPTAAGWADPELALTWFAPAGASDVVVEGDCDAGFNASLRRLYLGVAHSIEFPLPAAGTGRRVTRLDDYGWIVEVQ